MFNIFSQTSLDPTLQAEWRPAGRRVMFFIFGGKYFDKINYMNVQYTLCYVEFVYHRKCSLLC